MTNTLEQIVIDPDERTDSLMEAVNKLAEAQPLKISTGRWIVYEVRRRLHPLIHTFVPMKMYDKASNRIIATPWRVCLFCSAAKVR